MIIIYQNGQFLYHSPCRYTALGKALVSSGWRLFTVPLVIVYEIIMTKSALPTSRQKFVRNSALGTVKIALPIASY